MAKLSSLTNLKDKDQKDFPQFDSELPQEAVSPIYQASKIIDNAVRVKESLAKEIEQLEEVKKVSKDEFEESIKTLHSFKKRTLNEVRIHTKALQALKEREEQIVRIQNDYLDEVNKEILEKRKGFTEEVLTKENSLEQKIAFLEEKGKILAETYALIVKIHENLAERSSQDELERLQIEKTTQDSIKLEKDLLERSKRLSVELQGAEIDRIEAKRLKTEAEKDQRKAREFYDLTQKEITIKQKALERTKNVLNSLQEQLEKKEKELGIKEKQLIDKEQTLIRSARELKKKRE